MATLKNVVNDTYYWAINRTKELCSRGDFEEVVNGDSIRQEFDEWISSKGLQVAPQETEVESYIVGGIKQDVKKDTFSGFKL